MAKRQLHNFVWRLARHYGALFISLPFHAYFSVHFCGQKFLHQLAGRQSPLSLSLSFSTVTEKNGYKERETHKETKRQRQRQKEARRQRDREEMGTFLPNRFPFKTTLRLNLPKNGMQQNTHEIWPISVINSHTNTQNSYSPYCCKLFWALDALGKAWRRTFGKMSFLKCSSSRVQLLSGFTFTFKHPARLPGVLWSEALRAYIFPISLCAKLFIKVLPSGLFTRCSACSTYTHIPHHAPRDTHIYTKMHQHT